MAKDYSHLGLDDFGMAISSPPSKRRNQPLTASMNNVDFNANTPGFQSNQLVGNSYFPGTFVVGPDKLQMVKSIQLDGPNSKIVIGTSERITLDAQNQRIVMKDSSDVNRVLLDSENSVFKLSQNSFDVTTAGDDQLIWSSDFNAFKIVHHGSITVETPAGTASVSGTAAHNLGYVPSVIAFVDFLGNRAPVPHVRTTLASDLIRITDVRRIQVNGTNVIANVFQDTNSSAGTSLFTFYLMREIAD